MYVCNITHHSASQFHQHSCISCTSVPVNYELRELHYVQVIECMSVQTVLAVEMSNTQMTTWCHVTYDDIM